MIAALFVERGGVYFGIEGVDPWDRERDATKYRGPWPIVAHPPCERWGRYWHGGPSARVRRTLGDDGGCFAVALTAVRQFGGVLEHPEASHAFAAFGIRRPAWRTGWIDAEDGFGHVCCVAQGNYGHRARKLTWLYAVRSALPELDWRIPEPRESRLDHGFHSAEERRLFARTRSVRGAARLTHAENVATPIAFRDVLISMARSAEHQTAVAS